jgi:hypothetical protein
MTNDITASIKTENGLVRLDRMMESFRYGEYDFESSLGEIIDNSVEAGAKHVWIRTETEKVTSSKKGVEVISKVAIIDDGASMNSTVLGKSLILGETHRPLKGNGAKGIGRFGVGLTMGGIAIARRIDVYARDKKTEPFLWTYLDLNEVKNRLQTDIPTPSEKTPPLKYAKLLENSTGTIIILSECDRLQHEDTQSDKAKPGSELLSSLPTYLGRTYRKFIDKGLELSLNNQVIFLHDPLFMMTPTRFPGDATARLVGRKTIVLELGSEPNRKASVEIVMSLLPKEWRPEQGAGGSTFAKDRKIDDNEGISILRAEREVLYGSVPYLIGIRGQAKSEPIDRWWGCEISFPPELDDYFHVRYIKRGAEPIAMLKERIKNEIARTIVDLRKEIQTDWAKSSEEATKRAGVFQEAETIMERADQLAPKGKRGTEMSPDEKEQKLNEVVAESVANPETPKEEKKKALESKPYSIEPVSYPAPFFFETVHALGNIIIKLNINHPFYQHVFVPLCGHLVEDGNVTLSEQQRKMRNAIMLLLLSYAKAESFIEGHDELLENLRTQWGISLKSTINELVKRG